MKPTRIILLCCLFLAAGYSSANGQNNVAATTATAVGNKEKSDEDQEKKAVEWVSSLSLNDQEKQARVKSVVAEHLKAIRQEIDYNAADLKKTIDDPTFVKLFGEFRKQDQLKTVPRDYSAENENIDLLKLKSFIVFHQFTDKEILSPKAADAIVDMCSRILPLNVFLKNAIA